MLLKIDGGGVGNSNGDSNDEMVLDSLRDFLYMASIPTHLIHALEHETKDEEDIDEFYKHISIEQRAVYLPPPPLPTIPILYMYDFLSFCCCCCCCCCCFFFSSSFYASLSLTCVMYSYCVFVFRLLRPHCSHLPQREAGHLIYCWW
jgi:hypothetical protein